MALAFLSKAALVLSAAELGPATLAQLVSSTGLTRPTALASRCPRATTRMVAHATCRDVFSPRPPPPGTLPAAGERPASSRHHAGPPGTARPHEGVTPSSSAARRLPRACVAGVRTRDRLRDSIPVRHALHERRFCRSGSTDLGRARPSPPWPIRCAQHTMLGVPPRLGTIRGRARAGRASNTRTPCRPARVLAALSISAHRAHGSPARTPARPLRHGGRQQAPQVPLTVEALLRTCKPQPPTTEGVGRDRWIVGPAHWFRAPATRPSDLSGRRCRPCRAMTTRPVAMAPGAQKYIAVMTTSDRHLARLPGGCFAKTLRRPPTDVSCGGAFVIADHSFASRVAIEPLPFR